MTDIGDSETIETTITVDGVPTDPATIVLTVTDPSGNTSTPTINNSAVGSYDAVVSIDAAGRWLYRWNTTSPTGVDHGHIDVLADPPSRLGPLATVADLEEILGRDLTTAELDRAPGLLRSASTKVRAFCRGQQISRVDNDQVILRATGSVIILPQRPVIDVTAVAAIAREGGADLTLTGWSWDGLTEIDLRSAVDPTLDIHTSFGQIGRHVNRYRVTYSHGYDITPPDPVDVTAQAALRVLASPTSVEGTTQRTIGQFSEQFQQATGTPGNSPWLSKSEKQQLIDAGFRSQSATVKTSLR